MKRLLGNQKFWAVLGAGLLVAAVSGSAFARQLNSRNLPQLEDFVLEWDYPLMRLAPELNPDALRRPQAKNKVCSDREFVERVLGVGAKPYTKALESAMLDLGMSERTARRCSQRRSSSSSTPNCSQQKLPMTDP